MCRLQTLMAECHGSWSVVMELTIKKEGREKGKSRRVERGKEEKKKEKKKERRDKK